MRRTTSKFPLKLAVLGLVALTCVAAAAKSGGDAEPVDPAEFRVQTMPPVLPAVNASDVGRAVNASDWVSRGPAPTQSAQVRVPPDNEVCGAIHVFAPHPSNADILYVGAVNGGVWRTVNATAPRPTWTPLTDRLPSQSIGAIAFDLLDTTSQTLLVGTGRWSNFAQRGDDEIGVYRTTNGGNTWANLGATTLLGQKLIAVVARGSTLFAASSGGGLFRSVNTGANWSLLSGSNGIPSGGIGAFVEDPRSPNRLYLAVRGAAPTYLRSDDLGASWVNITAGITGLNSNSSMRIAPGVSSPGGGVVYTAVIAGGTLGGVFRSQDAGANWTALDVPAVHPGGQGSVNSALVADPSNANVVTISGDRITASPFTGNVARIDANAAPGTQVSFVVDAGANNTAPHADSRFMAYDANGNLLESDDGGIYRLVNPASTTRVWTSVIGNLNVMEAHNVARDTITNVLMIGAQDNGTHQQQTEGSMRWVFINGGDGGDVAIDSDSNGSTASFRYLSSQSFGGFRRAQYNNLNAFLTSLTMPNIPAADQQFVTPFELNVTSSARMLVGGTSNLYESVNSNSGAPTLVSLGAPGANRQAVAYGASNDPDALYVGKAAAIWKRAGAGGAITQTTALPAGAAAISDVTMDPTNSARVFATDDNQVFRSLDGGVTWVDVTGNLPSISGLDFRTVQFVDDAFGAGVGGVAVGTRSGVFMAGLNSNVWTRLGDAMPDVLVFDLRYLPAQKTLIAGTLGRGVWTYVFESDNIFANGFE